MSAQPTATKFEMPQEMISWVAPTRKFETRNTLWFIGLAVIAVVSFAFLVIFRELWLGLVIMAGAFYIFIMFTVKPPVTRHAVHNTGLEVSGKIYAWDDLDSFFVDAADGALVLKTVLSFPSELVLYLEAGKEKEIEQALLNHIPYLERKRTDYFAVVDGFVSKFSKKLPDKLTQRVSKTPNKKFTVDPNKIKESMKRTAKQTVATPNPKVKKTKKKS